MNNKILNFKTLFRNHVIESFTNDGVTVAYQEENDIYSIDVSARVQNNITAKFHIFRVSLRFENDVTDIILNPDEKVICNISVSSSVQEYVKFETKVNEIYNDNWSLELQNAIKSNAVTAAALEEVQESITVQKFSFKQLGEKLAKELKDIANADVKVLHIEGSNDYKYLEFKVKISKDGGKLINVNLRTSSSMLHITEPENYLNEVVTITVTNEIKKDLEKYSFKVTLRTLLIDNIFKSREMKRIADL